MFLNSKNKKTIDKRAGFLSIPSLGSVFKAAACTLIGLATIGHSEDVYHERTESIQADTALVDRDIISIPQDTGLASLIFPEYYKMISSDYILDSGHVPVYARLSVRNLVTGNITADFTTDDKFNQELKALEQQIVSNLRTNHTFNALDAIDEWGGHEQLQFCKLLSEELLSLDQVKAFAPPTENGVDRGRLQFPPTRSINRLSNDIENNTQREEVDCEQRGVIIIALAHRITEQLVSETNKPRYFYTVTDAFESPRSHVVVTVVSPQENAILGAIETTAADIYFEQASNYLTLSDFVKGSPLVTEGHSTLGFNLDQSDYNNARYATKKNPFVSGPFAMTQPKLGL